MTTQTKEDRQFRKVPLWNALFWLVLWLFSVWSNYQWARGVGSTFSWEIVFSWSFPYYMIMVLFGPLIYWLYVRWRERFYASQFLFHLSPAIVLGLIHQLGLNAFFALFSPAARTDPAMGFVEIIRSRYEVGFAFSVNGFLFYWLCIGLIFLADLYQRHQQGQRTALELQAALNKAKFETLQGQLQPHFLFNTFNSLSMMARQQKHKEVVNMIALVSNLLRETLSLGDQHKVTLEKELSLVHHYLAIEQVRFRDRLTIALDIAEESKACQVPVLFLQPIVENAFQHGISKLEGAASLAINVSIENSTLMITISNSGPLLPDNWDLEEQSGIGLSNVLSRLDHAFGQNYTLSLANLPDHSGVITKIALPLD